MPCRVPNQSPILPRGKWADRTSLLLGTALASTLVLGSLLAPTPVQARINCLAGNPPPGQILVTPVDDDIVCNNIDDRTFAGAVIDLTTMGGSHYINLDNSGALTSNTAAEAAGIRTNGNDGDNLIGIVNTGDVRATSTAGTAYGIKVDAQAGGNLIGIDNHGDLRIVSTAGLATGIDVTADAGDNIVGIVNTGDVRVTSTAGTASGIRASGNGDNNIVGVENRGKIDVVGAIYGYGITVVAGFGSNLVGIENHGDVEVTAQERAHGIRARAFGGGTLIGIDNRADLKVTSIGDTATGIDAYANYADNQIGIVNSGRITMKAGTDAYGIIARTDGLSSSIAIENSGPITVSGANAYGIRARSEDVASDIVIINAGDIQSSGSTNYGIHALTNGYYSDIVVQNFGRIEATGGGVGILIESNYADALVENYGTVVGGDLGMLIAGGGYEIGVINHGSITADSLFAVEIIPGGGYGAIVNYGVITGYIEVFGLNNEFVFNNEPGGLFEARLTSLFGGGGFFNAAGATVHTAGDPSVPETTIFSGVSLFDNKGVISMQDGAPGDRFQLTGSAYGYYSASFNASGDSTLAVDAFLGGPGSESDIFIIDGDVTGKTALAVNNTNRGPGVAGAVIPVVEIEGNVKSDAFFLPQPIDTGFFSYDLFFRPTGSGVFELRSFIGPGAFLLPQLITAAQDTWHSGSSTWFDRTADLRVLLAGGGSPIAYDPTAGYPSGAAAGSAAFTPAVWARGGGNWLDRDGSESVSAFGNNYRYKLDRDLEILDWQMGLDLGKRDFLSPGDILVFGVLGGFVNANLDYDQLARAFDFEGGQVGGYATYLRGGLFVDTLLNVHLLDLETVTQGFPSSLDATTVGLRTDTGYRFGSFNGGAFIEPLATIAVLWSDIDGFTRDGNTVAFDDEANLRGRLGLRAGTSYPVWTGTTMEPFVIGSVWGNLSGDNQATLVSNGTTFRFEDNLDDVWGEVSAGVNFFNPGAGTAVFAKVDVTLGDDVDGIGGKAGMRVSW